jgi:hypothetical protein
MALEQLFNVNEPKSNRHDEIARNRISRVKEKIVSKRGGMT